MQRPHEKLLYNIVVVGPGGTGKSCFCIQFVSGTFTETYDPTLEDSYRKQMRIDGEEAIMNIYDTAGQEDFAAVRDQYIRIAEGIILIYSVTTQCSFNEVVSLRRTIADITMNENFPCVLVANKIDLPAEDREVEASEGEALARSFGWKFFESSAKTKENVVEPFEEIVRLIRTHQATNNKPNRDVKIDDLIEKGPEHLKELRKKKFHLKLFTNVKRWFIPSKNTNKTYKEKALVEKKKTGKVQEDEGLFNALTATLRKTQDTEAARMNPPAKPEKGQEDTQLKTPKAPSSPSPHNLPTERTRKEDQSKRDPMAVLKEQLGEDISDAALEKLIKYGVKTKQALSYFDEEDWKNLELRPYEVKMLKNSSIQTIQNEGKLSGQNLKGHDKGDDPSSVVTHSSSGSHRLQFDNYDIDFKGAIQLIGSFTPKLSCKEYVLELSSDPTYHKFPLIVRNSETWIVSKADDPSFNPYGLNEDEVLAVVLYAWDLGFSGKREENFFYLLNNMLRKRSATEVEKWSGYIYYLQMGLQKIPTQKATVYRGVPDKDIIEKNYRLARTIHWSAFSSTSTEMKSAIEFSGKKGVIMIIEVRSGKSIKGYGPFSDESEILLSPNMQFVVTNELRSMNCKESDCLIQYVSLAEKPDEKTFIF